jgi:protein-L-isoaspartate(D-aspartate) O-methyltransferase
MTQTLLEQPRPTPMRVLEIGTGSGYQARSSPRSGLEVFTVERIGELPAHRAQALSARSASTSAASTTTAASAGRNSRRSTPSSSPPPAPALVDALTTQLGAGGTLVCPVGASGGQTLIRLRKDETGAIDEAQLAPVVFVPLLPGMVD